MAKAFTLLELVVVIIIVGLLASLALPRFLDLIEYSRTTEALANIKAVRESMERCYLMNNGSYVECRLTESLSFGPVTLDIENPNEASNAHFDYSTTLVGLIDGEWMFYVTAIRNTRDGGTGSVPDPIMGIVTNQITCGYSYKKPSVCVGSGVYRRLTPNGENSTNPSLFM